MKLYAACLVVATALASTLAASHCHALDNATAAGPLKSKIDPQAQLADTNTLIERAKDAVEHNLPTLRVDLNNLILALLRSKDIVEQYKLIDTIHDIGDIRHGSSPVEVKAYVQRLALISLPELPNSAQNYAYSKWSYLFPSRREMEREIGVITPQSREKEAAGLKVLRARELGVSYHTLQQAIDTADLELVQALLQAGLRVDMVNIAATYETVWSSLRSACQDPTLPAHRIGKVLDLLAENGFPINYADDFGHTLLSSAAMGCSGPVVERIIELGAPASQRDRKGITPLELALESERFDVADVLMKYGARLSGPAGKRVLFFPNRDARLEDYVKRATEPLKTPVDKPLPNIQPSKQDPA